MRVARHELPENEAFVGSPLTRGDRVAVVRQRYDASDAALLIFELTPPLPSASKDGVPAAVASVPDVGETEAPALTDPE